MGKGFSYSSKGKKGKIVKIKGCKKPRKGSVLWLDIDKKEEFKAVKEVFSIHPLTVDDCLSRNTRIKTEAFENYTLAIMYGVRIQKKNSYKKIEVDFILGKNFLITYHGSTQVESITHLYKDDAARNALLAKGPEFIMQYIMDHLVESYFPALAQVNEEIEQVEVSIFKKPDQMSLQKLFKYKKELMKFRKETTDHREVLMSLTGNKSQYVSSKAKVYFRDIYDKIIQLTDSIETQKEIISNIAETHTTLVSNKTNDIMKVLTVIATIMLPLSVIGSIYGMNFRYMPELHWKYGYPMVLSIMALIAGTMLIYFRRKKWI